MRTIALAAVAVLLSGCIVERAQVAHQAQRQMVGMPREQVLACMGAPAAKNIVGRTEVWTYPSGNNRTTSFSTSSASAVTTANGGYTGVATGPFVVGNANGNAITTTSGETIGFSSSRYCIVNVVMTDGIVSRVNYSGPTGGLISQGEQCAFAVQNCVSADYAEQHQAQSPESVAYRALSAGSWISRDGLIELKLSSDWQPYATPPSPTSDLQLQLGDSQGTELDLMDRNGRDVADLKAFSEALETRMTSLLTNPQTWPAQPTTINGRAAIQFEYAGVHDGVRVHCLVIVTRTGKMVAAVAGGTTESKFASERDKIMAAATGLRETTKAVTNDLFETPAPSQNPPNETSKCQQEGEHIACR